MYAGPCFLWEQGRISIFVSPGKQEAGPPLLRDVAIEKGRALSAYGAEEMRSSLSQVLGAAGVTELKGRYCHAKGMSPAGTPISAEDTV